jgi:hypothetical protein
MPAAVLVARWAATHPGLSGAQQGAGLEQHEPAQPERRDVLLPANAAEKLLEVHGDETGHLPVVHAKPCISGERLHVEVDVFVGFILVFEDHEDEARGMKNSDCTEAGPGSPGCDHWLVRAWGHHVVPAGGAFCCRRLAHVGAAALLCRPCVQEGPNQGGDSVARIVSFIHALARAANGGYSRRWRRRRRQAPRAPAPKKPARPHRAAPLPGVAPAAARTDLGGGACLTRSHASIRRATMRR